MGLEKYQAQHLDTGGAELLLRIQSRGHFTLSKIETMGQLRVCSPHSTLLCLGPMAMMPSQGIPSVLGWALSLCTLVANKSFFSSLYTLPDSLMEPHS